MTHFLYKYSPIYWERSPKKKTITHAPRIVQTFYTLTNFWIIHQSFKTLKCLLVFNTIICVFVYIPRNALELLVKNDLDNQLLSFCCLAPDAILFTLETFFNFFLIYYIPSFYILYTTPFYIFIHIYLVYNEV